MRYLALAGLLCLTTCGGGGGGGGGSLDPVQNLKVVVLPGRAELSWTPVAGATTYLIEYSTSPDPIGPVAAAIVVTVPSDAFTHVVLQNLPADAQFFTVYPLGSGTSGPGSGTGSTPLPDPVAQSNGGGALDFAGWAVGYIGDINGDGKCDVISGAPSASPGGVSDAGTAFVYSGANGALLYQINGGAAGDKLGEGVGPAGDVNGDGTADFIVGAPFAGGAGEAYVFSGADGSQLYQKDGSAEPEASQFGAVVCTAGDVNSDGKADFIVGAPNSYPGTVTGKGSIFVYSGADGGLLHQKNGEAANDRFGSSVSGGGDIDGDGVADFIVGSPNYDVDGLDQDGAAYVFSGATGLLIHKVTGDTAYGYFYLGTSVSTAGDVNGDGRCDFIVGMPGGNPGGLNDVGLLRVYSGTDASILWQMNGLVADDSVGYTVCTAGDVDGDGCSDFIAGYTAVSLGPMNVRGRFQVFSGRDGGLLYQVTGQGDSDALGRAVSTGGDMNGDGKSDFIAGAPYASPGGIPQAGTTHLFVTSSDIGIIPSETVDPYSLDGFKPMRIPKVAPSGTKSFTASGGAAPYTWMLLSNRSGGTLDSSGNYTAGSTADVFDTIRLVDSQGRSHDTRILVSSAAGPSLPKRPTSLTSVLVAPTQIDLTWTDNATDETGYVVEMRHATGAWSTLATLPAGSVSYSATGIDSDKIYLFRVKAVNAAADSAWSPRSQTTLPMPTGLATTPVSIDRIDLSWTDASGAETGFDIERMKSQSGASWELVATAPANATSYSVTGLDTMPGSESYFFRIRARANVVISPWTAGVVGTTP